MAGLTLTLEPITRERFAPFGRLSAFSEQSPDERFEVLLTEDAQPWRIAVFRVRQHKAERLECHPGSMESFEPMAGAGILLCAEPHTPHEIHAFLLDTPVCLYKGVWHEVIALSQEALYKITENREVSSQFHPLEHPLGFQIQNIE